MPDNLNNGYLEHFLEQLIDPEDVMLKAAKAVIDDLKQQPGWRVNPKDTQKALIHTYLAWQENPGRPFGTALKTGYLDSTRPAALLFLDWVQRTFQLA